MGLRAESRIVAGIGLGLVFAFSWGVEAAEPKVVLQGLQTPSGQILVLRNQQTLALRAGAVLEESDELLPLPSGGAQLLFPGGSVVQVHEGSRIRIEFADTEKKTPALSLRYGGLRAKVPSRAVQEAWKFKVRTRSAVMGVRGTDFAIEGVSEASPELKLFTLEGTVRAATTEAALDQPGAAEIRSGLMMQVDSNGKLLAPRAFQSQELPKGVEVAPAVVSEPAAEDDSWERSRFSWAFGPTLTHIRVLRRLSPGLAPSFDVDQTIVPGVGVRPYFRLWSDRLFLVGNVGISASGEMVRQAEFMVNGSDAPPRYWFYADGGVGVRIFSSLFVHLHTVVATFYFSNPPVDLTGGLSTGLSWTRPPLPGRWFRGLSVQTTPIRPGNGTSHPFTVLSLLLGF